MASAKRACLGFFAFVFVFMFVGVADAKAGFFGDLVDGIMNIFGTSSNLQAQSVREVSEVVSNENLPESTPVSDPLNMLTALQKSVPSQEKQRELPTVDGGLALLQAAPPALVQFDENQVPKKTVIKYTVGAGDTLFSIADDFDINVETIVWANEGAIKGDLIRIGDVLNIPPVVGVVHTVKSGETIASLAKFYNAKEEDITDFNGLSEEFLKVGEVVIVPFGEKPAYKTPIPQPKYAKKPTVPKKAPPVNVLALQSISDWLVSPTQGYNQRRRHSNNGVDVSNPCGTPVYAAAQGVVSQVNVTKSTKRLANGGYGNNIRIRHNNGATTLYAHMQKVFVEPNQAINQGDMIGLMGGQPGQPGAGRSTGCHLHWEVRGAVNPLIR